MPPNAQKPWSVPPNAQNPLNTQRPILNTQRPKKFLPLRGASYIGRIETSLAPHGGFGGRRRLGSLVRSVLGAAAARGGRRRGGGRRRRREGVYQPGRRETGGERAIQRPNSSVGPGGDPAARPNAQKTPNAQTPNAQKINPVGISTQLTRGTKSRSVSTRRSCIMYYTVRRPRRLAAALSRSEKHPTPNAQHPTPKHPTPKHPTLGDS